MNGGKANNSSPITTKGSSDSGSGVYVPPHLRGGSSKALNSEENSRGAPKYDNRDRDQQRGGDYRRGGGGRNYNNSSRGDRQSGDFSNFSGRGGGARGSRNFEDNNGESKISKSYEKQI